MFLSTFELFKIGVGPSSSHTIGPMLAANRFVAKVRKSFFLVTGIRVTLHGSLAFTGKGHATDRAVALGLAGIEPSGYDRVAADKLLEKIRSSGKIKLDGLGELAFNPLKDLHFDYRTKLPGHTNGMQFFALDAQGDVILTEIYYSIGGGFVVTATELDAPVKRTHAPVPYEFSTSAKLLELCSENELSVAGIMMANERARSKGRSVEAGIRQIWDVMDSCIGKGISTEGILPGGLDVKRRAPAIHARLLEDRKSNMFSPHRANEWIMTYAMAVNEENASGGQVVTAPTNGASGVLPATLKYYLDHVPGASKHHIGEFLLTAAAIGGIIKQNASISGAECGCQAEVGSASAMAAAGFCAVQGGTPQQIENAAEIALEHHLGMTCDPVRGLVQIPCIERNGMGAVKAVSASSLALHGDGTHVVPLDACVETMRQTGLDMNEKYKETSLGGLAVNVPNC